MKKNKFCSFNKPQGYLALMLLSLIALPSWGAGFQLMEQNAANLGTAYAGSASLAEEVSTGFYNAAGLTRLSEEQIGVSAVWINANSKVSVQEARAATSPSLLGGGNTKTKTTSFVPGINYFKRINNHLVFGLNIVSPFGLKTMYKHNSIARYAATKSELTTFDIAPSIAYDFGNGFSFGGGLDAVYLSVKLNSRINNPLSVPDPSSDKYFENKGEAWALGYHLGALWEITDCTRFGVNYRSKVREKIKNGDSIIFIPAIQQQEKRIGLNTNITLPETAVLSAYHALNEKVVLMADVQWTHWKRFKNLSMDLADGTKVIMQEQFRDTYRIALGGSYQYDDAWKLRVGTAFDKTPTQDAYRTVRIPDQNRIWGALGAQYRLDKGFAIDVGYAHLFFKSAKLNEMAPTTVGAGGFQGMQTLKGNSKSKADLIGIQLTWDIV